MPAYPGLGTSLRDVIARSGPSEAEDPYHYAPSLVRRVAQTPGQEIATHTFSHFYCLERGPTIDDFERDLEVARRVAARHAIELRSIVFPRNQYTRAHLRACQRQGLVAFRGNPPANPYLPRNAEDTTPIIRLTRLLDAYVEVVPSRRLLSGAHVEEGVTNVPASRFLRPVSRLDRGLMALRLRRVRREMTRAARSGLDYHLWWHPHNFGRQSEASFAMLDAILDHYERLRARYGMRSMTMAEAAART